MEEFLFTLQYLNIPQLTLYNPFNIWYFERTSINSVWLPERINVQTKIIDLEFEFKGKQLQFLSNQKIKFRLTIDSGKEHEWTTLFETWTLIVTYAFLKRQYAIVVLCCLLRFTFYSAQYGPSLKCPLYSMAGQDSIIWYTKLQNLCI